MTLSNFDWTDKTSVKWFIMLPTGHEGPYSLEELQRRRCPAEAKIWAEGLPEAILFNLVVQRSQEKPVSPVVMPAVVEDDEIPPLPPLPIEEEIMPPDEVPPSVEEIPTHSTNVLSKPKIAMGIFLAVLFIVTLTVREWVKSEENFSIRRASKMPPELFQRITRDFKFEGWGRKIFFKEYMPPDMSHIWLVTSSYQQCKVEAQFTSLKGKLLIKEDERVSFKTKSELKDHMVEFSHFEFVAGNKIIPGLYEMDLKATNCRWDGIAAKLGNWFTSPDDVYVARMKVVLYHKGNVEFNQILDKLIRKKIDLELKNQNQEELFWQDLQQKFQTLLAISMQIEQLLLDLVEKSPADFSKDLKFQVDKYTRNYGRFLTEFVVANEKYFLELEKSGLSSMGKKRSYESVVRISSKNLGLESMKIIESLQSLKRPTKKDLDQTAVTIKKQFEMIKESLNRRIIQLTEDRVQ